MTFGKRLQFLRHQKQLTQSDVAKALGVPRTTYASWEGDHRFPEDEREMLDKLASYFETSIDYLLGRTDVRQQVSVPRENPSETKRTESSVPPELLDEWLSLPEEARQVMIHSSTKLSLAAWRSVIDYIKFKVAEAEREGKEKDRG